MISEAITIGFFDELSKIASKRSKSKVTGKDSVSDVGSAEERVGSQPEAVTGAQNPAPNMQAQQTSANIPYDHHLLSDEPSLGSRVGEHFRDNWKKYLAGGAAAGLGYLGYKHWPSIKAFGSGVGSKARTALTIGVPLGIAAYGLGRGLKSGERARQLAAERDIRMTEAAQGRYEPFRMEG